MCLGRSYTGLVLLRQEVRAIYKTRNQLHTRRAGEQVHPRGEAAQQAIKLRRPCGDAQHDAIRGLALQAQHSSSARTCGGSALAYCR
jgi:hypothetical protein